MNVNIVDLVVVLMSVVIGIAADRQYYLGLDKPGHQPPNRWSWLIWSFSAFVEVATFKGISDDWLKVLPLATTPIACVVILSKVWKMKEDRWDGALDKTIDIVSVILSFAAIFIWLYFKEELWAHVMMICAVPISYIPQWRETLKVHSHSSVDKLPWMLWTIMDTLNLILNLHRINDIAEIPYVVVELICHASVWFLISFRRSA
ncbi:MAG: hypothetical protein RLZZ67_549 [Candidatus Parcubacteria bacterium]|jgi:hypothetical protein